jgi:hypothetical protein
VIANRAPMFSKEVFGSCIPPLRRFFDTETNRGSTFRCGFAPLQANPCVANSAPLSNGAFFARSSRILDTETNGLPQRSFAPDCSTPCFGQGRLQIRCPSLETKLARRPKRSSRLGLWESSDARLRAQSSGASQMSSLRHIREKTPAGRAPPRSLLRQPWLLITAGFLACLLVLVGPLWAYLISDSAGVQATFKNMDDRLGRIEQTLNDITRNGGTARSGPAPQTQGANREPSETISKFYLQGNEADTIRQALQAPKRSGATDGKYRVGQLLLGLAVKPIPDNLAEKVPQLRGLHYTFDPTNNAIAIIDPRSNRVIALI